MPHAYNMEFKIILDTIQIGHFDFDCYILCYYYRILKFNRNLRSFSTIIFKLFFYKSMFQRKFQGHHLKMRPREKEMHNWSDKFSAGDSQRLRVPFFSHCEKHILQIFILFSQKKK